MSGLQRITEVEFNDAVDSTVNYKKFFIFPGKSYLFVNVNNIKDILQKRFALESIVVEKTFPQTLNIIVEEKLSTIIYDNGEKYSYLGLNGNVVELAQNVTADEWLEKIVITTTTLADGTIHEESKVVDRKHSPAIDRVGRELGNYPVVYDLRGLDVDVNVNVLAEPVVQGVIEWFNFFEKQSDIPFGYIVMDGGTGEGVIKTREGWEALVRFEDVKRQFDELLFVLNTSAKRGSFSYIDLRYKGKVFLQ